MTDEQPRPLTPAPHPSRRDRPSAMQPDLDYARQRQEEMRDPEREARYMPGWDARNPPHRTAVCPSCGGSGRDPNRIPDDDPTGDLAAIPLYQRRDPDGLPYGWCRTCRGAGRIVTEEESA